METSIALHVVQCLHAFEKVSSTVTKLKHNDIKNVVDEFSRFKLWSGNIGAHHNGRRSLDYRLRDASHLQKQVISLLEELRDSLSEITSILEGDEPPWDQTRTTPNDSDHDVEDQITPGASDFEYQTVLSQLAIDVSNIVNCLLRLSISICNPAPHDRVFSKDTYIPGFEAYDINHVKAMFHNADEFLVTRLGIAISRRRQYFNYCELRRKKLTTSLDPDSSQALLGVKSTVVSSMPAESKHPAVTMLGSGQLKKGDQSDTEPIQIPVATLVPPLPKQSNRGPFECPFCFMMVSIETTENWQEHVYSDLRPYVCLEISCVTPDREFTRRHEWIDHMQQMHWKIWPCPYDCQECFTSAGAFKRHVQQLHQDALSGSYLDSLAELIGQPRSWDGGMECPLCKQALGTSEEYQRHVGRHQKQLALFALPMYQGDADGLEEDRSDLGVSVEDELRSAIHRHPRRDKAVFIPIDKFDQIITEKSIRRELQSCLAKLSNDEDLENWVRHVWGESEYVDHATGQKTLTSRRKIFAVLVLLNVPAKIKSFIEEGLWDKDLPFVLNSEHKLECQSNGGQKEARIVQCLNDPHEWNGRDVDMFNMYQWYMLAPIFKMIDGTVNFYNLHERVPLPFVDENDHGEGDSLAGGYGDVWRVSIHPAHYELCNSTKDQPEAFAIKRLRSIDKKQFDSKVDSLKRLSNRDNPHLIKLLATYCQDGYYHLIFPWAELGNLMDFWMRFLPDQSYKLTLWIAEQCNSIAKGLRMIHHEEFQPLLVQTEARKRIHGNIKPENILCFKDSPKNNPGEIILKISDFGLTRWDQHILDDKEYRDVMAMFLIYRAPECHLDKQVSQLWDIWTLGCLFLDFLTWYLYGWEKGVDEFSKRRALESTSNIPEDNFFNLGASETGSAFGASLKGCVIDVSILRLLSPSYVTHYSLVDQ
ncbi:hypothetical protein F4819DRAFT_378459 [Hypoxylon fuscum]|nr:hypothetical protein F4819DRAFT_378459 [Hypoxylon fuscum]